MHHFFQDHIIGPTELRRHLGKYLRVSEQEPVLILDRGKRKKILIDLVILEQYLPFSQPTTASETSLDQMNGLFGKSHKGSVPLQKSIKRAWYQKHS